MAVDATEGGADANSYVAVTYADAYWLERANAAWAAATDEAKESALIRSAAYIEARYSGRWKGTIAALSQALAWPRSGVTDDEGRLITGVPKAVKAAACELALIALGRADLATQTAEEGVLRKMQKVGPIETEFEYASGSLATDPYRAVSLALKGLVTDSAYRLTRV